MSDKNLPTIVSDLEKSDENTIDIISNTTDSTNNSTNNSIPNATIADISNEKNENIPITTAVPANNLPTVGPTVPASSTPVATPITYTQFQQRNSSNRPGNLPANNNFSDNSYSTTHYVEAPPEDYNLQKTWQYGKTIKCLSIIDAFFIIMNSFIVWPLIISILFPICGYYGSKKYEVNKVFVYMFYCLIRAVSIVVQLSYSFNGDNYYDDDSYNNSSEVNKRLHSNVSQVFLIFSLLIQLWITWIVYRFASTLRSLPHDKLNTLRIGTFIPIETRVLFY